MATPTKVMSITAPIARALIVIFIADPNRANMINMAIIINKVFIVSG